MTQCLKHQEYECIFLNLKEGLKETRLLCELCIQEQSETCGLNIISIAALKNNNFNQYQKLLQFVDEDKILIPFIKFDLVKNGALEQINQFYDEISTIMLSFVESKRDKAQKSYYGLLEAQSKLQNFTKLEELKSILKQSEQQDTNSLNNKLNDFFASQMNSKQEIKKYLEDCVNMTNILQNFTNMKENVSEIKEKVDNVLKLEDNLQELSEINEFEAKRVQLLRNKVKNLSQQIERIMNFHFQAQGQKQSTTREIDIYEQDLINKTKSDNYLMLKIADAIKNKKILIPLEFNYNEEELIFSRTQPGANLIGIIDVPLDFDVFGKSFKIKVLEGFVSLGICARDINVKRCFRYDAQLFSKSSGFVMFTTSGFSVSSFNASQHNTYLKTHYSKDSIVEFTPCDNKLSFGSEYVKKADYMFEPQDDVIYCPCFMLSENSSIQFLVE